MTAVLKEQEIRDRDAFRRYREMLREDIGRFFSDQRLFQDAACPGCGLREEREAFRKVGFRYVVCSECETLYATPRPSAEALQKFYVDSPSSLFWVESFFKPVAEVRREKIFKPRAKMAAEKFDDEVLDIVGDIGAGFGIFLEEFARLKPAGRRVAIEPSSEMAAICSAKGLEVAQSSIEELRGFDGQFGLLTCFELLEHLHEPRRLLRKSYELLRPGGRLLLTTLNGLGFDIQVMWEDSKSVFPPHHINFLNPRSLSRLLSESGFQVEELSTPGRLDWNIVEENILKDGAEAGRFWEWFAGQGSETAKVEFQNWIAKHGFSSHMMAVARKP